MIIDDIRYRKNSADILAGGEEYKKLPLAEVVRFGIKKGAEIDERYFSEFLRECDRTAAKEYLFGLLARGPRTEQEARIKLYQKGFRKESVLNAIELAKQYKYISDEAFADFYIQTNKQAKGAYRIKAELKQKGVPAEIIEEAAEGIKETEKDAAAALLPNGSRKQRHLGQKNREKLIRHLASRGFSYDIIKQVLSDLGSDTEDFID